MGRHSRPGEGILSPELHEKLENFLFSGQNSLTVTAFAGVFLSSLIIDEGLRTFFFGPLILNQEITDIWLLVAPMIFLGATASVMFIVFTFMQSTVGYFLTTMAGITVTFVLWFTSIEYLMEWSIDIGPLNGLLLPLGLYYSFSGFIGVLAMIHESSYITKRISLSESVPRKILLIIILMSVVSNVALYLFLRSDNYTWAFAVTFVTVLFSALQKTQLLKI